MTRVFVARLAGLSVFDPLGDPVGRGRDVVVTFSARRRAPRGIGLVVEVSGRRRVFVPMTRVTSVDAGQVITTGLVNMRRFEQRANETLVLAELLERTVTVTTPEDRYDATVEDVAIEQERNRDWVVVKVFCRKGVSPSGSRGISRLSRRRGAPARGRRGRRARAARGGGGGGARPRPGPRPAARRGGRGRAKAPGNLR